MHIFKSNKHVLIIKFYLRNEVKWVPHRKSENILLNKLSSSKHVYLTWKDEAMLKISVPIA